MVVLGGRQEKKFRRTGGREGWPPDRTGDPAKHLLGHKGLTREKQLLTSVLTSNTGDRCIQITRDNDRWCSTLRIPWKKCVFMISRRKAETKAPR